MFVVKRCVRDYEDVWKTEVFRSKNEQEADEYADTEDAASPWHDVWHEVIEEE